MEQNRIDRINELAKLAKQRELPAEEAAARAELRKEFLAAFRKNLTDTLDNTYIVDEKGNKTKLEKKKYPENKNPKTAPHFLVQGFYHTCTKKWGVFLCQKEYQISNILASLNRWLWKPNQKWVTDVTEFRMFGQKL